MGTAAISAIFKELKYTEVVVPPTVLLFDLPIWLLRTLAGSEKMMVEDNKLNQVVVSVTAVVADVASGLAQMSKVSGTWLVATDLLNMFSTFVTLHSCGTGSINLQIYFRVVNSPAHCYNLD